VRSALDQLGRLPRVSRTLPAPPAAPPLDDRMRRYMRARAARRRIADTLSGVVRIAYRGRLDPKSHAIIIPESSLSPWRSDEAFRETLSKIEGFTLVDEMRLYELWHLTAELATVPGDILEVGVWRGGSGCLMASQSARSGSDATVYLCDTFSGVVKAGDTDPIYEGGEHGDTSPALVRALAASMGLDNVEVLVGTFPDESGDAVEARRFKLVHLDVDVYEGTKDAATWVWPRLVEGGVIVVDDYGGDGMDGVRHAVDEFADQFSCRMIHNLNGHAILVKVGVET
jgi:O-methyltransferase